MPASNFGSYSNAKQKLGHVDCSGTVRVELVEDFQGLVVINIKAGVVQAFGELFSTQRLITVVIDPTEASAKPQNS